MRKRLLLIAFFALPLAAARLPQSVIPSHYAISIEPNFASDTFRGDETIDCRIPPDCPRPDRVAASGLAANDKAAEANPLGVNLFLSKPYTAEKLLRALAEILHNNEAR